MRPWSSLASRGRVHEEEEEDSPYEEVRASVSNIDVVDMPGRSGVLEFCVGWADAGDSVDVESVVFGVVVSGLEVGNGDGFPIP